MLFSPDDDLYAEETVASKQSVLGMCFA